MIKNIFIKFYGVLINTIIMIFSLSCIFPLIWIGYSSLKTQKEFALNIISLPSKPQFGNYIQAFKVGKMQTYFMNSVFTSLVTLSLVITIAFVTAYFLSRYNFKARNLLYMLFLSGMLIPVQSLMVPIFVEFKFLHLLDKRITLLFPYVAFGIPMIIFLMESFIKSIPVEMEEAAFIDGSSTFNTLFKIIMPMCRPVISVSIILNFLGSWNEFSFALILISRASLKTLTIGLTNFSSEFTVNYTQLMAGLVIAILPVIITYMLFHKKIIQGMTAGAVKG